MVSCWRSKYLASRCRDRLFRLVLQERPLPCARQHLVVDISSQDPVAAPRSQLIEQNGECTSLGPVRAASGPHRQAVALREQFRHYLRSQCFELLRVSEELADIDGDPVQELLCELAIALHRRVVLLERGRSAPYHICAQPALHLLSLVGVKVDSVGHTHLALEVVEIEVIIYGRSFDHLRLYLHRYASSARILSSVEHARDTGNIQDHSHPTVAQYRGACYAP